MTRPQEVALTFGNPAGGLTGAPAFNRTFNNPTGSTLSTMVAIYEVRKGLCVHGTIEGSVRSPSRSAASSVLFSPSSVARGLAARSLLQSAPS